MDISHLRCFLVVAECENISYAAKKLYMSQPSLSKVISQLEKEVGVSLFHRTRRSVALNTNGLLFQKCVQQSLQVLDEGLAQLAAMAQCRENTVRVAYYGPPTLDNVLEECQISLGNCHLEVECVSQAEVLRHLELGETDIGIQTSEESILGGEAIAKQDWVAILTDAHPCHDRLRLTSQDIAKEVICFTGSTDDKRFIQSRLQQATMTPLRFSECTDTKETARLINQGVAIGIMEDDVFYHRKQSTPHLPLRAVPLEGDWSRTIYLIRGKMQTACLDAAYDTIRTHIQQDRMDVDNYFEHN